MRAWRALALLLVASAVATACGGPVQPGPEPVPPSPFEDCPATVDAGRPAPPADALPPLTLPCFSGGAPVAIAALGKPAVINLWASWCGPCRTELPQLQAFADESGEQVEVLGVVTQDTWSRAAYAGQDFGVRFPMVFDPERQLQRALGRNALPVTVFVTADGTIRTTDMSGALTLDKLRGLAREYLGVGA